MFSILDGGRLPLKQTFKSGGYDCFARVPTKIKPNTVVLIPLGFKLSHKSKFLKNHHYELFIRSSLSIKGLTLANGVGLIDVDFEGEVKAIIRNVSQSTLYLKKGERIAQIVLKETKPILVNGIERVNRVNREGGFGSTGSE
jgi:dUTP pyrophosphatase